MIFKKIFGVFLIVAGIIAVFSDREGKTKNEKTLFLISGVMGIYVGLYFLLIA